MRLFTLAAGRARPVIEDAVATSWDERTAATIRETVLDLVPTPLLPLVWREDVEIGEYLVALDPAGVAAVVVVRAHVDPEVLVAAMARYALVRDASWREIASWYGPGEEALRRDWAGFRESLPPRAEPAAGLYVLTGHVTPQVRQAARVLDAGTVVLQEVTPTTTDDLPALAVSPIGARARRPALLELDPLVTSDAAVVEAAPEAEAAPGAAAEPAGSAEPAESAGSAEPAAPAEPAAQRPDPDPDPDPATTPATGLRRRARRAVEPNLAPDAAAGLRAVAHLVGEAEVTLDGSGGALRGVLRADGTLVAGGARFTDPSEAAAAVTGRRISDGWAAWRFGPEGPFLGEALEEALNPQRRAPRPHRRRAVRR